MDLYSLPLSESLGELCRRHQVERLYLFGSAVDQRFDPLRSDLDFLVAFGPQTPTQYADNYLNLADELENLCGRPVDLVTEPSIRNSFFRESVFSTRQLLYEQRLSEAVT